jgi:crotonobetainyl-CoA:carnitine CoA-transferase CaiB-like acyl-CoA transferase
LTGPAALEGLLVVSLEQAVAAPYCTAQLADAGARVIKVERPEGDFARGYDSAVHGESAYFVWLNRGKQSVALDLKNPDDAGCLRRMIARADVFVQNLAPGATDRLGFGSAVLRLADPRLITCDISGYGEDGDWAERKAYDLLIQCESGLASITGPPGEPGRVGVSAADIACGMNAHAAILQALYARERTGEGDGVAVSLFDGMADWMAVPLLHQQYAGRAPARVGLAHPSIAPYGAYQTGDRRQTVLAVQNEREWRTFCQAVLRRPDLADDERLADNEARCANRSLLDAEIGSVFAGLTAGALTERLHQAGLAYGSVNTVADLARHPRLRRIEVGTPTGPVSMPAPPARFANAPSAMPAASPGLDQQGAAIWAEFAAGCIDPKIRRISE